MLNPDGVILGNYRTGVAGRDLNRQFNCPEKMLFPSVVALKELVAETKRNAGDNLILFIDMHGHSVKKNVFMYGPDYPVYDLKYFRCRLLPKILADKSDMFRFYSCIFKISYGKRYTARAILLN